MIAVPVDPFTIVDTGCLLRIPQLQRPREATPVLVDPVERDGNELIRVVLEVVPDRNRRVSREFLALPALCLVGPQILRDHLVVRLGSQGTQQCTRESMQAGAAAN